MSTAFRDDEAAAQTRLEHLREENQRLAQELARLEPPPPPARTQAPEVPKVQTPWLVISLVSLACFILGTSLGRCIAH